MWLLFVFIVSVAGAAFILVARTLGLKTGRQPAVSRFLAKGDPFVAAAGRRLQALVRHHSEKAFFLFLIHIPSRAELFFKRLRARTHAYYHETGVKIRGKRDLNNDVVSPYLRSMSFRRDNDK